MQCFSGYLEIKILPISGQLQVNVLLDIFLFLITLVLFIPAFVVAVECLLALKSSRMEKRPDQLGDQPLPRIAILVPAHNEAPVIAETIKSILPQLKEQGGSLLVVADNCTDNTAEIALECGAEVAVRNDSSRQGKGYAMDFGIRALEESAPDVVIIIDADCLVAAGSIEALAKKAMHLRQPVQATYLMKAENNISSNYELFGQFAWVIKNLVRPLGTNQFNMPCMLNGSGMAFPWQVIRDADLANPHITEDLKLGIELALGGHPTVFCPEALVTSIFPSAVDNQKLQRKRWEHGYLNLLFHFFPILCVQAIKQRSLRLLAIALDLMVPPLALFCFLLLFGVIITGIGVLFGSIIPFLALAGVSLLFFVALMLARSAFAKDIISIRELLKFPVYIIMKLPLYVGYIHDRETKWRRSRRK